MCRRVGFYPDDGTNKISENVRKYLQNYTVSHPSRNSENFKSIKLTPDMCFQYYRLLKVYLNCKAN
jgi:hypothetical protein